MPGDSQKFTVQVDHPRRYRGDRTLVYPPAGPVGEGAGDGIGAAVEPAKVPFLPLQRAVLITMRRHCETINCCASFNARWPLQGSTAKKILLILAGLLVLAAAICGVGWFVFLKDTGGSTESTTANGTLPWALHAAAVPDTYWQSQS